jgi:hypothetical protein
MGGWANALERAGLTINEVAAARPGLPDTDKV